MIFPISKAKYKIIKRVYEDLNIRISDLLKKTNVSQKAGYVYVNELLDSKIISQKIEPPLRILKPEFGIVGRQLFSLIEEEKKLNFLEKHKELRGPIYQFEKELLKNIFCALIFGSFSKHSETKESDIDFLIIADSQETKKIEKAAENCFITLKNKTSIRFVKKEDFIISLRNQEEFSKQILNNHIVIINSQNWINLVAESINFLS